MSNTLPLLLTHAGAFHADELMAVALLERFAFVQNVRVAHESSQSKLLTYVSEGVRPEFHGVYGEDGVLDVRQPLWLFRTRHPEVLAAARFRSDVFVIDVGGDHDPDLLNFDHHQSGMSLTWNSGTPYSSTGLVWCWLDAQSKLSSLSPAVKLSVEALLIEPLDAHDNGVSQSSFGELIEDYNRTGGGDPEEQLIQFEKALLACREKLENVLYQVEKSEASKSVLRSAWASALENDERFVVLKEPLPGSNGTQLLRQISSGSCLFLGLPSQMGRYSLISLPASEDRFSIACPVPEGWRGRMDFTVDIPELGSVKIAFAHKTGFMCVVDGGYREVCGVARFLTRPVSS